MYFLLSLHLKVQKKQRYLQQCMENMHIATRGKYVPEHKFTGDSFKNHFCLQHLAPAGFSAAKTSQSNSQIYCLKFS